MWTWQDMLQTGMIVGGWDKYEGGKIYGVPLGGTIVEQPFSIGGMLLFSCVIYLLKISLLKWGVGHDALFNDIV